MAISIARTIIVYITIMVSMRVMGKRQLGELEPAELVVAVLISDIAAHPLQDTGIPLLYGLVPALTLVCLEIFISAVIVRSVKLRSVICGKPSFIIYEGKLNQAEMKKNRFTLDELTEELRKKDITDISTVNYAVLETNGTLSTILYAAESPLTPAQMNLTVEDKGYPVIVINDGRLLKDNLRHLGFDETWLQNQMRKRKVKAVENVFIMTADRSGNVVLAGKER